MPVPSRGDIQVCGWKLKQVNTCGALGAVTSLRRRSFGSEGGRLEVARSALSDVTLAPGWSERAGVWEQGVRRVRGQAVSRRGSDLGDEAEGSRPGRVGPA